MGERNTNFNIMVKFGQALIIIIAVLVIPLAVFASFPTNLDKFSTTGVVIRATDIDNIEGNIGTLTSTSTTSVNFLIRTSTAPLGSLYLNVATTGSIPYSNNGVYVNLTCSNQQVILWSGGLPTCVATSSLLISGAAGGGSVTTSSAITVNNFPFWSTTNGGLSGTSTLTISGTTLNNSGTITVNGTAVLTSAPATNTIIAGGTATGPAITFSTSGPLMSIACSSASCTFTSISTSTILAGFPSTTIPTNNNQLTNGAGYLTTSTGLTPSNFATTSVSQWANNAGYLTSVSTTIPTDNNQIGNGRGFTTYASGGPWTAATFSVTNNLNVSGTSALQGTTFTNATGTGNLQIATLKATGATNLSSTVNVSGAVNFASTLNVSGIATLVSTLNGLSATLTSFLNIGGAANFSSTVTVSGVTSALHLASATGTITAYGGAANCSAGNHVAGISATGTTVCTADTGGAASAAGGTGAVQTANGTTIEGTQGFTVSDTSTAPTVTVSSSASYVKLTSNAPSSTDTITSSTAKNYRLFVGSPNGLADPYFSVASSGNVFVSSTLNLGYTIISSSSVLDSNNKTGTATCPTGYKVIGGGLNNATSNTDIHMSVSSPTSSGQAWEAGQNEGDAVAGTWQFTVYAICVRFL